MSRNWWIALPGSPEIIKEHRSRHVQPHTVRRPRIPLFKGGESVIRLSLGRRLVNLLPVAQRTNAFTVGSLRQPITALYTRCRRTYHAKYPSLSPVCAHRGILFSHSHAAAGRGSGSAHWWCTAVVGWDTSETARLTCCCWAVMAVTRVDRQGQHYYVRAEIWIYLGCMWLVCACLPSTTIMTLMFV